MVQKVIKIGSSAGVTIPKKQLEALGLAIGDEVKVSIKPARGTAKPQAKLMAEYREFTKIYGPTLKRLAKR